MQLSQIATLASLPDKAARGDEIGAKLQDLGLAEPTSTPGAAAPSTTPAAKAKPGAADQARPAPPPAPERGGERWEPFRAAYPEPDPAPRRRPSRNARPRRGRRAPEPEFAPAPEAAPPRRAPRAGPSAAPRRSISENAARGLLDPSVEERRPHPDRRRRLRRAVSGFRRHGSPISARSPSSIRSRREASEAISAARPELVDRNGEVLATDIKVMSVFAEPRNIIDKDEATELITAVLPDVNASELRAKLGSRKGFVWIKRGVTPQQQQEIFRLGLPGVGFLPENKRVYPNGPLGAHVLGFTNSDNNGIAGIEKYLDGQGLSDLHDAGFNLAPENLKPVALSLDMRATHALRDELVHGMERFQAKAAAAAIMDVNTGEVIAEASLPDYDPNNPSDGAQAQQHQPPHRRRL